MKTTSTKMSVIVMTSFDPQHLLYDPELTRIIADLRAFSSSELSLLCNDTDFRSIAEMFCQ
jgi:hypothetical protein